MYPGARGLMGHKWTLEEKYPGTVPCAQSPIWMMSPLLHWLENPEFTFCCKMAHDVVPEEVKIVSGPFLPLCQLWFPRPDFMRVTFLKSVCWLWNHFWQASKLFSSQKFAHTASLLDLSCHCGLAGNTLV